MVSIKILFILQEALNLFSSVTSEKTPDMNWAKKTKVDTRFLFDVVYIFVVHMLLEATPVGGQI